MSIEWRKARKRLYSTETFRDWRIDDIKVWNCFASLHCAMLCSVLSCVLCFAVRCYAWLCFAVFCCVLLRCALICLQFMHWTDRVPRIGSALWIPPKAHWTSCRSGPEEISDVFAILFGCTKWSDPIKESTFEQRNYMHKIRLGCFSVPISPANVCVRTPLVTWEQWHRKTAWLSKKNYKILFRILRYYSSTIWFCFVLQSGSPVLPHCKVILQY